MSIKKMKLSLLMGFMSGFFLSNPLYAKSHINKMNVALNGVRGGAKLVASGLIGTCAYFAIIDFFKKRELSSARDVFGFTWLTYLAGKSTYEDFALVVNELCGKKELPDTFEIFASPEENKAQLVLALAKSGAKGALAAYMGYASVGFSMQLCDSYEPLIDLSAAGVTGWLAYLAGCSAYEDGQRAYNGLAQE